MWSSSDTMFAHASVIHLGMTLFVTSRATPAGYIPFPPPQGVNLSVLANPNLLPSTAA
jgi:hypothetical protein